MPVRISGWHGRMMAFFTITQRIQLIDGSDIHPQIHSIPFSGIEIGITDIIYFNGFFYSIYLSKLTTAASETG
jgi:hypothetical protein